MDTAAKLNFVEQEAVVQEAQVVVRTQVLKVSSRSQATAVAGAIAGVMRQASRVQVEAIGAGAVNQAIKAIAIARSYLVLDGFQIICIPGFTQVEIGDQQRTAIKFVVESR